MFHELLLRIEDIKYFVFLKSEIAKSLSKILIGSQLAKIANIDDVFTIEIRDLIRS
jgi:hypothetical protein